MFSIQVSTSFNAVHAVTINGVEETPHDHHWKVSVVVEGKSLDKDCVLIDFLDVESRLEMIVAPLSESNLNIVEVLECKNPSAEQVALYIGKAMSKQFHGNTRVQSVTVTEAPNCQATYTL